MVAFNLLFGVSCSIAREGQRFLTRYHFYFNVLVGRWRRTFDGDVALILMLSLIGGGSVESRSAPELHNHITTSVRSN